ncbi:Zinc finger, CCCH-type [Kalmanozyma brasiliensis GHG001]|uniref:Pre-mRNA-splicing factor CWC24 n=1 Tax=Kalmanozyma brasiliensis (strain GHG001) TaxID=1365824 RepID=V5EXZ6_KALBG|nr:Zinc finger, CCCH-type [Kalmanozyma brasiliensis GHG001]EST08498.1 Zinc finger, CCCH-type [Kalmanozyma brasiliensis GHG001]
MDVSADASSAAPPVVVFKRKRGPAASTSNNAPASSSSSSAGPSRPTISASTATPNRTALSNDSSDDDVESSSAVVIKKKRSNNNPLVQSTGSVYRKSKLGSLIGDDGNDDDSYALDTDSSSHPCRSNTDASATSRQKLRDDATKHSNWDLDSTTTTPQPTASNADGLYRGASSYTSYIAARDDGTSSKMRSRGPIRQTTTVRTTSLMDYQPDICKDYKETGYCGFGDTCKFLHDRSDYLAGWQLDVLPNSSKNRENLLSDPEEEEEEEIPFACLICRQPFTDPVVTQCGHYFCSGCAIKRFSKNSKCFACGKQTGGLFNSAKKVLDKMQASKRRKDEARAERSGWLAEEPIAEIGGESEDE